MQDDFGNAVDTWVPPMDTGTALVDNRTDLPDHLVERAVMDYFIEHASLTGQRISGTSTYGNEQSLMHRQKFQPPQTVREEIKLARDLAERDDDVAAALGAMVATAFGDGMENFHEDEQTVTLFNGVAREMNLDAVLAEMYREFLISFQVTTVGLYTRSQLEYQPEGGDGRSRRTFNVSSPRIGILPAENIVPLGSDLFNNARLAYNPEDEPALKEWLEEFFGERTTAARKAELRREDPIAAALYVEEVDYNEEGTRFSTAHKKVYRLNPRMVARTCGPKGAWRHPRPLLTRNFPLLEAKRLLNLMDHALLQGGVNFIVVAKKGSDDRPALPAEVENLKRVVATASRTGVIVGDHRLNFEIITPNLESLLNPAKRRLIGRKIAQGLLRVPEHATEEAAQEGMRAELEFIARVIGADRRLIRRHVENHVYQEVVARNGNVFRYGGAKLWFPKIVLQGTQYFTDFVLKLRDRGDIPRKWAVEAGGFDYEAGLAQRRREVERGDDETLMPAAVPFSDPQTGPQDNNPGRPPGSSPDNGAPNARPGNGRDRFAPRTTFTRNPGETVRAFWAEDEDRVVRMGEQTRALLEQFDDTAEIGRLTSTERDALNVDEISTVGPLAVVPVNMDYAVGDVRAVRLAPGASLLVGNRRVDNALVAKALVFRSPEFDLLSAEETALQWGFGVPVEEKGDPPEDS